jgi:FtsZ-binding cell division protein ZapB
MTDPVDLDFIDTQLDRGDLMDNPTQRVMSAELRQARETKAAMWETIIELRAENKRLTAADAVVDRYHQALRADNERLREENSRASDALTEAHRAVEAIHAEIATMRMKLQEIRR